MFVRNMEQFNTLSWGPWAEFGQLTRELDRLLGTLHSVTQRGAEELNVNVWEGDDGAIVTAQMPGVTIDDIDVQVHDTTVTLSCERSEPQAELGQSIAHSEMRFGALSRQVSLPFAPDAEAVEAKYSGGVLEVRIPRAASDKPRRIQIHAGR